MKTDLEIQKDVMDELKWNPHLHASEIGVAVKNGIVTLSGYVDSFSKKISAEEVVRKVSGTKAIAENIQVKISPMDKKTDVEIAEAVLNAFKWNSLVPENKIKVKVEDGIVTMDGEVEWDYQRTAARNSVTNLNGVRGVNNNIKIALKLLSPVSGPQVKGKIISAFHRSATLDAQKINVEISEHCVTLAGRVRSPAEKEDAERAAWSALGVTEVVNKLQVDQEAYAF